MRSALLLLLLIAAPVWGQETRPKGKTWQERLPLRARAEVQRVRADATVRTSIPPRFVNASPQVYRYLLTHLPQAGRWLAALKLGDYAIQDLPGGRFQINDKAGARAVGERALDEKGLLCVVARGRLEVALVPKIRGTGVILIRFPQVTNPATKKRALRCEAEVSFRVQSALLHRLSRPFRRALARVLRDKMAGLVRAATSLAERIQSDPLAVYRSLGAAKVGAKDLAAFRREFLVF
jgi:hypothetical protein